MTGGVDFDLMKAHGGKLSKMGHFIKEHACKSCGRLLFKHNTRTNEVILPDRVMALPLKKGQAFSAKCKKCKTYESLPVWNPLSVEK